MHPHSQTAQQTAWQTRLEAGVFLWAIFGLPFLLIVGAAIAVLLFAARTVLFAAAALVAVVQLVARGRTRT